MRVCVCVCVCVEVNVCVPRREAMKKRCAGEGHHGGIDGPTGRWVDFSCARQIWGSAVRWVMRSELSDNRDELAAWFRWQDGFFLLFSFLPRRLTDDLLRS